MKVDILCVGRIKEKFFCDSIDEYSKRLSKFCKLNIIEARDEKTPDNASDKVTLNIIETEAERIQKNIDDKAFVIALCIEGKQISSTDFADKITSIENDSISHIQFIIGGSLGLSDGIKSRADMKLSFSKMTFPHQLMRVVLLEQLYRAYKIKAHEPYHK